MNVCLGDMNHLELAPSLYGALHGRAERTRVLSKNVFVSSTSFLRFNSPFEKVDTFFAPRFLNLHSSTARIDSKTQREGGIAAIEGLMVVLKRVINWSAIFHTFAHSMGE